MTQKVEYHNYDTTITIKISLDPETFDFVQKVLNDKKCKTQFEAIDGKLVLNTTVPNSLISMTIYPNPN